MFPQEYRLTHTHTDTRTGRHTETMVDTYTYTGRHIQTCRHSNRQIDIHTDIQKTKKRTPEDTYKDFFSLTFKEMPRHRQTHE